ncbi:NAD(P)/FAD-dependent oxidoreductase (plasmid) [Sphingomonas paeninsulae]|uniref:NAD(P)/FAD-dependent oxidoreductase n=2 Tax=Sphingomonas paeninsulae TaxID=2319844 RepID=A0A494T804_SPHPE|nr:NAD(P)/FAD-dependent oxidoreductase [Sphingomonas paeninsulae]
MQAADKPSTDPVSPDFDVVIVGAGIGGLYSLYKLRSLGFRVHCVEAAESVGGTWYWNRYPGARCDIESLQYSYSFDEKLQQEWEWSERFAAQPEILRYLDHVADRFDLKRNISFNTWVAGADFDEAGHFWSVKINNGSTISARFCIMATGALSAPRKGMFEGEDRFKGEIYHTALWPHTNPDLTGKRVGIIGTSASGTQAVPHLARQASHLTVYQRTANFSIPSRIGPVDPAEVAEQKANYSAIRAEQRRSTTGAVFELPHCGALEVDEKEREAIYERRWTIGGLSFLRSFNDLFTNDEANATAVAFVHNKLREKVKDQETAEKLLPRSHAIGARRICTDYGYYEAFNRDNVSLVDILADPIVQITEKGIRTESGEIELDVIVMATGFNTMVGALTQIDIRGRGGELLRDKWQDGPKSYLGMVMAGFPNLLTQAGPLTPGTLGMFYMLNEQQGNWIADLLVHMRDNDIIEVEATSEAEVEWVQHIQDIAKHTLHYKTPESSYFFYGTDGNRVFLVFIGGFNVYSDICKKVAGEDYKGLIMRAAGGVNQGQAPSPLFRESDGSKVATVFE